MAGVANRAQRGSAVERRRPFRGDGRAGLRAGSEDEGDTSLAGFLDVARAHGWNVVHTVSAAAQPSGPVTRDAFERIAGTHQVRIGHSLKFSKPTGLGRVVEQADGASVLHVGKNGRLTLAPENQMKMFGAESTKATA